MRLEALAEIYTMHNLCRFVPHFHKILLKCCGNHLNVVKFHFHFSNLVLSVLLAKFDFDIAEKEPSKVSPASASKLRFS